MKKQRWFVVVYKPDGRRGWQRSSGRWLTRNEALRHARLRIRYGWPAYVEGVSNGK